MAAIAGVICFDLLLPKRIHNKYPFNLFFSGIVLALTIHFTSYDFWQFIVRALPLVTVTLSVVFLILATRPQCNHRERLGYQLGFLWSIMSVGLLAKMILKSRIGHYGFVLAMPATLLFIAFPTVTIPNFLHRKYKKGSMCKAAMLGLVGAVAILFLNRSNSYYKHKDFVIGQGKDHFFSYNANQNVKASMIQDAIRELRKKTTDTSTLLVLPEGVTMNYLLRKPNPTPYYLLTPWEFEAIGGEAKILLTIREHVPDFIAVLNINMKDHGRNYFGEPGYGKEIMEWITENYILFKQLKQVPYKKERFRIDLYQHHI